MEPDGLCKCGCGQRTPLSPRTYGRLGIKKGDPLSYVTGHQMHPPRERVDPNPSGLCMCGCGERTNPAPYSRYKRGWVEGKPLLYVAGHHRRKSFAEYDVDPVTGCWNWLRAMGNGYGVVPTGRTHKQAHRVIYERFKGPIPDGHDLHHECGNKRCVNPEHLTPVTKDIHSKIELRRGTYRKTSQELQETALALKGTMSARAAARSLGIHRGTVERLWRRGHVK